MRGTILFVLLLALCGGIFAALQWSGDIDAALHKRQVARVLAPLDKKIAAAEAGQLSAAAGLKGQRERILQSLGSGYHPYLLPENRIFADRLKKLNPRPFSAFIESVAAYLNPYLRLQERRAKSG